MDNVLWGRLPSEADSPICHINPGEIVVIETVSHEGMMEDQGRDPLAWFSSRGIDPSLVPGDSIEIARNYCDRDSKRDGPHIVTGPIGVRGARPGDIVKVEFLDFRPRVPHGVVSARHFQGALPGEVPAVGAKTLGSFELEDGTVTSVLCEVDVDSREIYIRAREGEGKIIIPLAPFLGLVGVTPAGDARRHSVPPGYFGGNIDVRDLVSGSALYLPVQVDEAGLYFGDPHFAQGRGEVALTAVEAPLSATIRASVMSPIESRKLLGMLERPMGESGTHWYLIGLDKDLDQAMKSAVREALRFMVQVLEVPREEAYAYLSAAADFVVTQVVDEVKGVHCQIRKSDFRAWI